MWQQPLQHYTVVRTRGEGVLLHTYQDGQIQHPTKKMCCKHQRFLCTTLMIRVSGEMAINNDFYDAWLGY